MFTALSQLFHLHNSHFNRVKELNEAPQVWHTELPCLQPKPRLFFHTRVRSAPVTPVFSLTPGCTIPIHQAHHVFPKRSSSSQFKSYKSLSTPVHVAWVTALDPNVLPFHPFPFYRVDLVNVKTKVMTQPEICDSPVTCRRTLFSTLLINI